MRKGLVCGVRVDLVRCLMNDWREDWGIALVTSVAGKDCGAVLDI